MAAVTARPRRRGHAEIVEVVGEDEWEDERRTAFRTPSRDRKRIVAATRSNWIAAVPKTAGGACRTRP